MLSMVLMVESQGVNEFPDAVSYYPKKVRLIQKRKEGLLRLVDSTRQFHKTHGHKMERLCRHRLKMKLVTYFDSILGVDLKHWKASDGCTRKWGYVEKED